VTFEYRHRYGPSQSSFLLAHPHVRVVHFNTTDVSWASRGSVDGADLSSIAANLGKVACYGLSSEGGIPCGDWYADATADGHINGSDLSSWAYEHGHWQHCEISKASPEESTERILAWFGMRYSGQTEVVNGIEMPQVAVVNEAQMRRAILDPNGYRNSVTGLANGGSWTNMKTLYR
jgi:hypothetical protein